MFVAGAFVRGDSRLVPTKRGRFFWRFFGLTGVMVYLIAMSDSELLRRFAEEHLEQAFAELVSRRISLVYSAALRQVGDAHRAEDVTQEVFIDLARKARSLSRHPALIGWLYTSTHFTAAKLIRTEQRRARREQEAHAMHDSPATPASQPDWDRVRPVIDAAMHELDERDRQTVLLRFFDQQPFARIGAQLGLTENAAQKTLERALDKLQAALARRGVKSSAAALGIALANQIGAATAPATLAAAITNAAMAGAAAGAVTAGTAGVWAALTTSKMVAGFGCVVAAGGIGTAVVQSQRAREAETAFVSVSQNAEVLRTRAVELDTRIKRAEQRAAEAERDSGELLNAVEAFRTQKTAKAPQPAGGAVGGALPGGIVGMVPAPATGGRSPEEEERLANARSYQQQLAQRRAKEAKERADVEELTKGLSPEEQYNALIDRAELHYARAEFQLGIRVYNRAMETKPPHVLVTERVKQLQAALAAQNGPVTVTLKSDGNTWVSIANTRQPEKLESQSIPIMPGDYEIVGRRKGYRDVNMLLQVRKGVPPPVVTIVCTVTMER